MEHIPIRGFDLSFIVLISNGDAFDFNLSFGSSAVYIRSPFPAIRGARYLSVCILVSSSRITPLHLLANKEFRMKSSLTRDRFFDDLDGGK